MDGINYLHEYSCSNMSYERSLSEKKTKKLVDPS